MATLEAMTVPLHIRLGDEDPFVLAEITVPVTADMATGPSGSEVIVTADLRSAVAQAVREVADRIEAMDGS